MSATGDYIREAREQKGLTLGQVEEATRIPRYYLEILEGGGDDRLVSDRLYMVHFLRGYATYLEVEVETLAAQFVRENRRPVAPAAAVPIRRRRPWRAIVLAGAAALVAAGAAVYTLVPGLIEFEWLTLERPAVVSTPAPAPPTEESVAPPSTIAAPEPRPGDANSSVLQPEADETAPPEARLAATAPAADAKPPAATGAPTVPVTATENPSAAVSTPGATAAATPDTEEARPPLPGRDGAEAGSPDTPGAPVVAAVSDQAATPSGDVSGNHTLTIAAGEKAWLRVWIDDQRPKDMLLEPGESRTLAAQTGFVITFGNAGGVRLLLNGEELPPAGRSGQVVRNFKVPAAGQDTP